MEMQNAIKLVDPRKRVEVSGFHMNQVAKSVQLIRSETYLTELMETICKYYEFWWHNHIEDNAVPIMLSAVSTKPYYLEYIPNIDLTL